MEFNELELLVREPDNNNEAHLHNADKWQFMYPEVERECTDVQEVSGSSNNHLMADSATTSMDNDPVVTVVTPCRSCLPSSEDFFEAMDENKLDEMDLLNSGSFNTEVDKGALVEDSPTKHEMEMEREGGYDPKRIPSSVFERSESSARTDWSNASNESLFSLHGGISFGRDHVLVGSDSNRVRELSTLDEHQSSPPSASDQADDNEAVAELRVLVKDKTKEEDREKLQENELAKPLPGVMPSSVSCRSDASDGSTFSFAFPILAPGGTGKAPNNTPKGGGFSPSINHSREPRSDTSHHSREPHSEHENAMGRPQRPSTTKKNRFCCFSCFSTPQPPSSTKKTRCCSCSCSCSSCFAIRSCSCCRHPRCSSCWPFKS